MNNRAFIMISFCFLLLGSCNSKKSEDGKVNGLSNGTDSAATNSEVNNDSVKSESDILEEKSNAQDINKKKIPEGRCDLNVVLKTQNKLGTLTDIDVYNFLFTFSEVCSNNVEYGEFSNETLFKVLTKHPDLVSKNLSKDSIYQEVILNELANPVTEMPNLDEIITKIESLNIPDQSKKDIVASFKTTLGYQ